MHAKIENIIVDIPQENDRDNRNPRIITMLDKTKASIHRRQTLTKIANRSKDTWKVVEGYETDD